MFLSCASTLAHVADVVGGELALADLLFGVVGDDGRRDAPVGDDKAYLQAWELIEQLRLKAELVVPSACETALPEEARSEGITGLTRAFQFAGDDAMVASMWIVPDTATERLMRRFYRSLSERHEPAMALTEVQRQLIQGNDKGDPSFSHPLNWAGFQVYGVRGQDRSFGVRTGALKQERDDLDSLTEKGLHRALNHRLFEGSPFHSTNAVLVTDQDHHLPCVRPSLDTVRVKPDISIIATIEPALLGPEVVEMP